MSGRIQGGLWLGLAIVLYASSAATAFALIYAFTVRSTLAAVESAFGTFVLLIMLLVFARKCWEKGKNLIEPTVENRSSARGKSL